MIDPFIAAAGPAPARGTEGRWRQVALLAASSAMGNSPRAAAALAATLLALDHPAAAAVALQRAEGGDPWARWWAVLAGTERLLVEFIDGLYDEAVASSVDPASVGSPIEP